MILQKNDEGLVYSLDKIADELKKGKDDLSDWVKEHGHFFVGLDNGCLANAASISNWATTQQFKPEAISTFFKSADYWICAHAAASGSIVVTHEVWSNGVNRIKIPNVCKAFGVTCINPFDLLRREKAHFIL